MVTVPSISKNTFRVIIKDIPGADDEFLISPYPQVVDSAVRSYRIIAKSQVEKIEETGDRWTSMGRTFPVVDLTVKADATVSLASVLNELTDEKIVEPRTPETIEVATRATQLNGGQGGIYVMGSCESCWCDNVWC